MKTWSNRRSWKRQEEEFGMDKGSKQGGKAMGGTSKGGEGER
jgi:hypothetical protein